MPMEIVSRALGMLLSVTANIIIGVSFLVIGTTLYFFPAMQLLLFSVLHGLSKLLLRSYSATHFPDP